MNELKITLTNEEYEEVEVACEIMQCGDLPEYVRTTLRKAVANAMEFGEIEVALNRLDAENAEEGGNEGCSAPDGWTFKKPDEPLKPFATFYELKKALNAELGMTGEMKDGWATYHSPTGMPLVEISLQKSRKGCGLGIWGLGGCCMPDDPSFWELRRRVHAHA